jgi:glycosyltransferase involved in cell wall biosynthesis
MRRRNPPRVLHVLHALNRGGVEKWLLDVLRNTPAGSWSTEFLVHTREPAAYDAQILALGASLRVGPDVRRPLSYGRRLRELLRAHGPYDVVHSHLHLFSGMVMRAAHQAGVPVRIAHSHTSQTESSPARLVYAALMGRWIRQHATHCVSTSAQAAAALFGADWRKQRVRIVEYGLDFSAYAGLPDRGLLKQRLGLPAARVVIGHVGRFAAVKNHSFVVATFAEILRQGQDAHLLLVGTGSLENAVRRQLAGLGIADRCLLAGGHDDVTPYFGAMDLLLFPSLYEGLGLVALEAQAAAVPVLASTAVPGEAEVVNGLLHRYGLEEGPAAWARAARQILESAGPADRAASASALMKSRFGVAHSVGQLAVLYGAGGPGAAPQHGDTALMEPLPPGRFHVNVERLPQHASSHRPEAVP